MTMLFQTVKTAAVNILGAAQGSNFQTIGYQRKNKSADSINQIRFVQIYYTSGDFAKSSGALLLPKPHTLTLNIDLTVSVSAQADVAVLNNPASTPAQKATALAGVMSASELADDEIDELISLVWNILMDGRNLNLGLAKGIISNRWIPSVKKDSTLEGGKYALKTARIEYECTVSEIATGDTGKAVAAPIMDSGIETAGDTTTKAGVLVQNT